MSNLHHILNEEASDDTTTTASPSSSRSSPPTSLASPSFTSVNLPTILVRLRVPRECGFRQPSFGNIEVASTADKPILILDRRSCFEDILADAIVYDNHPNAIRQEHPGTRGPGDESMPTLCMKDEEDFIEVPPQAAGKWEDAGEFAMADEEAVPYDASLQGFYGHQEETANTTGRDYIENCALTNGIGQKVIGREYEMDLKPGLTVKWWRFGTKLELLPTLPRGVRGQEPVFDNTPQLPVQSTGRVRFRVVE